MFFIIIFFFNLIIYFLLMKKVSTRVSTFTKRWAACNANVAMSVERLGDRYKNTKNN